MSLHLRPLQSLLVHHKPLVFVLSAPQPLVWLVQAENLALGVRHTFHVSADLLPPLVERKLMIS